MTAQVLSDSFLNVTFVFSGFSLHARWFSEERYL